MRTSTLCAVALAIGAAGLAAKLTAQAPQEIKRVGMAIGLKPEMIEEYKRLHAAEELKLSGTNGTAANARTATLGPVSTAAGRGR